MEDIGLSLDTTQVERGTKKTVSALDNIIAVLQRLESAANSTSSRTDTELNRAMTQIRSFSKKLGAVYESIAKSAKEGTLEYPQLVQAQNQAIQMAYEARLATEIAIGDKELQYWRSQGAQLGAIQKSQLKDYEDTLKNRAKSAPKLTIEDTRAILGMPSRADMAAFTAQLQAQMEEQQNMLRLKAKSAPKVTIEDTRAMLGMPSRADMAAFAVQLQAEMQAQVAQTQATLKNKVRSASKVTLEDTRAILGMPSRADMAAFAAQLQAQMQEQQDMARMKAKSASKFTLEDTRSLLGMPSKAEMATFTSQLKAQMVEQEAARVASLKASAAADAALKKSMDETNASSASLSTGFKKLASDGNDVHSMARGLASGFNALWLTWGNLAPLFIGATISNGFMQTAKAGMEVAHTLKTIEVLGGNSTAEMRALTAEMDNLSRSGPFGPLKVADAMKTLSLAGLKANEIIGVTKDVLNFAVAGNTGIEKAASTLMSVTTAFSMGTAGFGKAADVIAKASAVSMTSVENFSNAMKTASVINAQYGVSLEDTATAIAAMSQLGIEGTAAGTALRNMYSDLSGRSQQVAKALRSQGIEMRDSSGKMKPLITVVADLNSKLQTLDGISQKNLLQTLLSERGAKGIIELLRLINTEAKDAGAGLQNALVEAQKEIADNAGFSAIAAAKLNQTAQKQFEAVKATLTSSMVEVYREMDPTLVLIADRLKQTFGSEEFKAGLKALVTSVAEVTAVIVDNAKVIGVAAATYAVLKVAQMATVSTLALASAASVLFKRNVDAETVALNLNTTAQMANSAAKGGAIATIGVLARAIPYVGTAITVATTAYMAYDWWINKSNDSNKKASDLIEGNVIKDLTAQAEKLEAINALRAEGLTQQEAELKLARLKETSADVKSVALLRKEAQDALEDTKVSVETRNAIFQAKMTAAHNLEKNVEAGNTALDGAIKRLKDATAASREFDSAKPTKTLGTGTFDTRDLKAAGAGSQGLTEQVKNLHAELASLKDESSNASNGVSELDKISASAAKQMEKLKEEYKKATKATNDLSTAQLGKIGKDYEEAKSTAEKITSVKYEIYVKKLLNQQTEEQLKLQQAAADSADEVVRAQNAARASLVKANEDAKRDMTFQQGNRFKLGPAASAAAAQYELEKKYRDQNLEDAKSQTTALMQVEEQFGRDSSVYKTYQNTFAGINSQKLLAQTESISAAQTKIYQDAWNSTISNIASDFTSQMMNGTLNLKEFMIQTFAKTVLMPQINLLAQQGFDALLGGGASGWFGKLMGFEGGGYTGSGPRSGGMDGKGGFLAMVHPDETVVDHKQGGSVSSGPVYITITNTVGDVATKSMLDQYNAATVKQIQAGLGRSMRYNGVMSRG